MDWMKVFLHGQPAIGRLLCLSIEVIDCTVKLPPHCFRPRPDYTCGSNWTCYLEEVEGWILCLCVCVCVCVCLSACMCAHNKSCTFFKDEMCFYDGSEGGVVQESCREAKRGRCLEHSSGSWPPVRESDRAVVLFCCPFLSPFVSFFKKKELSSSTRQRPRSQFQLNSAKCCALLSLWLIS